MSIESFIKKIAVQTAVYWGSPVNNGYGGKTFAEGVEIQCRWQETGKETIITNNGKEYVSNTQVLVTQDLDVEGWLYLGTIAELNTLGFNSLIKDFKPNQIDGAYQIRRFSKIPMIKSGTKFVRTAYL
jgi:hypothetical protein